jgi:hypothetical protein
LVFTSWTAEPVGEDPADEETAASVGRRAGTRTKTTAVQRSRNGFSMVASPVAGVSYRHLAAG